MLLAAIDAQRIPTTLTTFLLHHHRAELLASASHPPIHTMPSTFRHNTASTALILLGLALSARGVEALSAITPEGCYSASAPLQNQGSYLYQTTGYCQPLCVNQSLPVMALTGGDTCYCGSELPTATAKVDSSNCNSACVGYPSDTCTLPCPTQPAECSTH